MELQIPIANQKLINRVQPIINYIFSKKLWNRSKKKMVRDSTLLIVLNTLIQINLFIFVLTFCFIAILREYGRKSFIGMLGFSDRDKNEKIYRAAKKSLKQTRENLQDSVKESYELKKEFF